MDCGLRAACGLLPPRLRAAAGELGSVQNIIVLVPSPRRLRGCAASALPASAPTSTTAATSCPAPHGCSSPSATMSLCRLRGLALLAWPASTGTPSWTTTCTMCIWGYAHRGVGLA
eukprot:15443899-Alexandrium_andersonii.AAC.1